MTETGDNNRQGTAPAPPTPPPYAGSPWAAPTPPSGPPQQWRPRGGGIGLGLFLIALGVVFLATQFVPGLAWWSLWPLLIIAGGFIQTVTPDREEGWGVHRIFDGIGTVLIGLVFLGNTTGYVSWNVWWVLLTLWPVFIIALGISVLGRGLQQSWLRALSPLVIWLALAYAVAASFTGVGGMTPLVVPVQSSGAEFTVREPVSGATAATLDLKGSAGDISLASGSSLVEASGSSPFGAPTLVTTRHGDTADAALTLGTANNVVITPGVSGAHADVKLSGSTLWDANISTGASNLDADLSDLRVRSLALKSGVGTASLKLGEVPSGVSGTDVTVKSGVSSLTILVPRDAEVRLDTHTGLNGTSVGSSFVRQSGGVWQTPGYSANAKALHISVESGIGSVSVQTY